MNQPQYRKLRDRCLPKVAYDFSIDLAISRVILTSAYTLTFKVETSSNFARLKYTCRSRHGGLGSRHY